MEGMGLVASGHKHRTGNTWSAGDAPTAGARAEDVGAEGRGVEDSSRGRERASTARQEDSRASPAPGDHNAGHGQIAGDSSTGDEAALRQALKPIRRTRLEAILGESMLGRDRYRTVSNSPLEWMLGKVPEHKFVQALSQVTADTAAATQTDHTNNLTPRLTALAI